MRCHKDILKMDLEEEMRQNNSDGKQHLKVQMPAVHESEKEKDRDISRSRRGSRARSISNLGNQGSPRSTRSSL